jgi:hypothetical protein
VRISLSTNGSHHPARAGKATMSKTADRVLGVHGFVRPSVKSSTKPDKRISEFHSVCIARGFVASK